MSIFKKWIIFVLFGMLTISTVAVEQAGAAGQSPVTAYNDVNYSGTSQELAVGFYNVNQLKAGVGNDTISSMKVAQGYRVTLYQDANFSGPIKVLTADSSSISDFNDNASSLKVELIGAAHLPVTLYSNAPYGGYEQELGVGSYDVDVLVAGVGNDQLSALRIAPGYKVTVYKDKNYTGQSATFVTDMMYIGSGFNDNVSSIKVEAISPIDGTNIALADNTYSDASKRQILQTFAPRIWFAQGEVYFPSSVEYTFPFVDRYLNTASGNYEFKTKTTLNPLTQKLPYFAGDLANAPIYAFWVEKEYNNVDLVYFQFTPYDLGKNVLGTEVGDHVGDWERITVRVTKFVDNNTNYVKPVQAYYGAHGFGTTYGWNEIDKINNTHPVVYNASGSHGMWKDAGTHVYQELVVTQLTDVTNQGTAWDTWNNIQAFQYYPLQGTGNGLGNAWPTWLDKDYTNPNGGAVYRFGNPAQGTFFGQDLFAGGPSGPQEKTSLTSDVILD